MGKVKRGALVRGLRSGEIPLLAEVRKLVQGAGKDSKGPDRGAALLALIGKPAVVIATGPAQPRAFGMVPLDALNDNEERVLFALETNGPSKIGDVAEVAWADLPQAPALLPPAKAQSWVRNALRRLVASGWVVQLGPGLYGAHESLEPRLGGLAVADAEDAFDGAQRELERTDARIEALRTELRGTLMARAERKRQLATCWKALLAARKAVR